MNYSCASLGVVVTLGLAGCNVNNPLFEVSSGSADATSASSGGEGSTSVTPTSEPVTSTTLPGTSGSATDVNGGSSTEPQTGGSTGVNTGSSSVGEASSGGTGQPATCGDGVQDEGEECDDGNVNADDGCSASCMNEVLCGNEMVDPGEQCDDGGNNGPNKACLANCVANVCGDGDVGPEEECDLGPDNNNLGSCSGTCMKSFCGDGFINLNEMCDDGESNGKALGGCSEDCSAIISKEMLTIKVLPAPVPANFNNNVGIAGGDKLCQVKVGATFKMMASDGAMGLRVASTGPNDGLGQKDWVLAPHRAYANADGKLIFITGKERLLGVRKQQPVPLVNPIGAQGAVWTGLTKTWQSSEDNCGQWSGADPNVKGATGNPAAQNDAFIGGDAKACSSPLPIYCVQQPL